MNNSREITLIQAVAILVSTIVGVGILNLPLTAVQVANSGAPMATLLGMIVSFCGLALIALLGMRFPTHSFIQYSEEIVGKWFAWFVGLFMIALFGVLTALVTREFGEVVVTAVLKDTPLDVTVIIMLLLAATSSRKNMTVFAYIHYFYFPFLLVPVLMIVALSLKNAEMIHLQPIWGNQPNGMSMGILKTAALFQGAFIMLMIIPSLRQPQKALQAGTWGMLIVGVLYLAIVIATVSVFGSEETKNLMWPTLELSKATSLPANVLERLDAAFLVVWVTAVYTSLLSCYYFTVYTISQLIRLADHRMLSWFILPFVYWIAMQPQNIVQMNKIIEIVGNIGLLITIVYPGVLLLIALIRRKKGASDSKEVSKESEVKVARK